jgi:hypothetical protein
VTVTVCKLELKSESVNLTVWPGSESCRTVTAARARAAADSILVMISRSGARPGPGGLVTPVGRALMTRSAAAGPGRRETLSQAENL